jgi:hypothetical protein
MNKKTQKDFLNNRNHYFYNVKDLILNYFEQILRYTLFWGDFLKYEL